MKTAPIKCMKLSEVNKESHKASILHLFLLLVYLFLKSINLLSTLYPVDLAAECDLYVEGLAKQRARALAIFYFSFRVRILVQISYNIVKGNNRAVLLLSSTAWSAL